ncbi:GNAT family N-acetyltransferase [Viridibacillus sp. FSL R5-0477]|uniref:GCN5-like N-acetyltransferase n=2 Tax=Viridibacillus TaxID=496496 RepID=W4EQV2_9BACL|nr:MULTISPECIES: GNAT family N-acetyltransferase [Viridibacillus]ETT82943.1 GCN5-like N-acetyltransferase [Viridibacillus arenosi FSL R5-213]
MDLLLLADPSEHMIAQYIRDGNYYIASMAGEDVGVVVLLIHNTEAIDIMNIAVVGKWQGQGFGKSLIQHVISEATAGGYRRILIATDNSSIGQLALYQKYGFHMIKIEYDYLINHYKKKFLRTVYNFEIG